MEKVKSRLTKIGRPNRTSVSSGYEPSPNPFKKRSRSISEILDDHSPSSGRYGPHLLMYHGYTCVEDPRSNKEVLSALRAIRGGMFNNKQVNVSHEGGTLRVEEKTGDGILVCPLHSIGLVSHDVGKGGYNDCLVISFNIGHYAKQCHTFQAKSSREASDVVQALQKAFRNATKERKSRKMTESGPSQTKIAAPEGAKVRRPMQFMEDEDEVIEHKSIASYHGGRRESKKTLPALTHTSSEGTTKPSMSGSVQGLSTASESTTSLQTHLFSSKDRRKPRKPPGARVSGDGEFTQQDKVDQLLNAVERIQENNMFLKDKARRVHTPTNIFEDSLLAMGSGNHTLLTSYMTLGNVVNSQDSSGNTLLHYAVALGQVQTVKMLCSNNASMEAAGWNDCKPIHRAVAEGNTPILQILLRHGANVNSVDLMRRTALHFSAAQLELMECSISLLEYGAHVMVSDLLGLRPFDLNPELKETVNRLVTSACETFVSAPLVEGGKDSSPPEGTPNSGSPASSVPSTSLDDLNGHDLNQLVSTVTRRAQDIASRASARRKKFQKSMTHPYSRSHGNLLELQESEEDEILRKDRLKFPSDYALDFTYQQMLGKREEALVALRQLIRASKEVGSKERVERRTGELETSLSDPELYHTEEVCNGASPPRPCSSAAVLQDNRKMRAMLGGGLVKFRADSGSSTGTLKDDTDSESQQQLNRAFDILQDDLKRSSLVKSQDELGGIESSVTLRNKLHLPQHFSADSTPLMERRSKEETVAIFDELLSQMQDAAETCKKPAQMSGGAAVETRHQNVTRDEFHSDPNILDSETSSTGVRMEAERVAVMKRRVQSNDAPEGIVRPSSSASANKEEESEHTHPPRAASVETDLVFATLPKKKRGKWHGIKRIGSPLFSRSRRKSFNATPTSSRPTSNAHAVVTGPSPSAPIIPPAPTSQLALDSRSRDVSRTSLQNMVEQFTAEERKPSMSMSDAVGKRRGSSPRDECLNALKVMTTLSSNQECLGSLISYICLPKCVTKLIEISQNPQTTAQVLSLISSLVSNLYQSGGTEGKKSALGSGVLDLTIKLLQSREPIPSTCLAQLNRLLISEDDNDYLRTIIRIPTAPLLQYLEACEGGGDDSGYENSSRPRRDTTETSSDATSTTTDEGVGGMGGSNYLGLPPRHSGRSSSFNSETSETSSGKSVVSPSSPNPAPELDPKRIVLKMLAVSSTHSKMQISLSTERAISLLAGCSAGLSHENTTNALITLANIAQNVGSHDLFHRLGVVKQLQSLSSKGPRPRYHASRALVYLGQLELLQDFDLFDTVATGYETDIVIYTTDSDGHSYARGVTIEKCVELLTSDLSKLWGGFSLVVGPHPSKKDSSGPSLHASKDQILQFILTTYKSFVHPLVLMRLLLHRLSHGGNSSDLFNWSKNITSISPTSQPISIPLVQSNILNLIGRWLELYSDDFRDYQALKQQLENVLSRLKLVRGPYIPHTHRLKSLLQDVERPRTEQLDQSAKAEPRPPHHDNLYRLCQQMVTGGHLPITLDQAIFMASLQLHLEDITGNFLGTLSAPGTPSRSKTGTTKIKSAFPPGFSKSKSIMKRVKMRRAEFEGLSERNAKHLYIERCQTNPGYDCAFFTVRVPSSARFKRGPVAKQLMGINNKRIVFLDEKSKELIASHSLQSVSQITRESDPCVLLINLHGDAAGFKVQLDSAAMAKEVANILEERREGEGILDESNLRWSDSVPSLFTMSTEPEMADTDSSGSTLDPLPAERGATPPGHMLSYDMLKNPSPDGLLATPNGHMETLLSHKSDTLRAFSHDESLVSDLNDHLVLSEKERLLFCDCPPDPQIPPELNLKSIVLVEILSCPLEVARQMTLIAHARFQELNSTELLQKVNMLPKNLSQHQGNQRDSIASTSTLRSSMVEAELQETAVEKLAFRFNQVGNWVAHSILQFEYLEERAEVIQQFIAIAKHCYELGNFSSMMAIVVAGLGSAPIRRLHSSWAQVPKADTEIFKEMDTVLDSRGNYKIYRDKLNATELPAVPYVGVFLKDLTFICDGNPDYLRGGLINMHKRRQVYRLLEEIHHYQKDEYKLHAVPDLQQYLLAHKPVAEDDLHATSHNVEPRIRRSNSNSSTKSFSSIQPGRYFFKRTASSGSSYHNRTSLN